MVGGSQLDTKACIKMEILRCKHGNDLCSDFTLIGPRFKGHGHVMDLRT